MANVIDPKGYGTLNISVEGLPELNSYLNKVSNKSKLAVASSMPIIGAMMQGHLKASVQGILGEPRSIDTGAFHDSISFIPTEDSVTIKDAVSYGKFVEIDTRYPGRWHFTNTLQRQLPDIYKIINFNLQNATR